MQYVIRQAELEPRLDGGWDHPSWASAETGEISHFHAASTDHRPRVRFKLLHHREGISVMFDVWDRYVRSVCTQRQGHVCKDSCVEFFVEPIPGRGYFNFEVNCGGHILLWHVTNSERTTKGLAAARAVDDTHLDRMRIHTTMPSEVIEEIVEPVRYQVAYFAPFELFEAYVGPLPPLVESTWRGNFYKCADATSHPHWGSWAPIGERLNFHQSQYFGEIKFETVESATASQLMPRSH